VEYSIVHHSIVQYSTIVRVHRGKGQSKRDAYSEVHSVLGSRDGSVQPDIAPALKLHISTQGASKKAPDLFSTDTRAVSFK
jgi:hypothetical protein